MKFPAHSWVRSIPPKTIWRSTYTIEEDCRGCTLMFAPSDIEVRGSMYSTNCKVEEGHMHRNKHLSSVRRQVVEPQRRLP
mmetsp:Transcript_6343/g.13117  ORF Transcript_6343/g.13117 Transcript_6343/m.13117 type:complete len:80 (+) Transcript_6343:263-502(+)